MKRCIGAALALWAAGCASRTQVVAPPEAPPPAVANPNIEVLVLEVVETREEDTLAYVKVFADGAPAGQTTAGPRSSERRWLGRLPAGNRLLRFEVWEVGPAGDAQALAEPWQPRERFVRVEEGSLTRVQLKFWDKGRRNSLDISRQPAP